MSLQNPNVLAALNQLQDIITPPPVGWWPLSNAVWAILVGVFSILTALIWYLIVRHKNNRYRREAQSLLQNTLQQTQTNQQKITQANQLLKQVAMTHYGRQKVAHLIGQEWVDFLHQTAQYIKMPEKFLTLLNQTYAQEQPGDLETKEFIDFAQAWIKGHHK